MPIIEVNHLTKEYQLGHITSLKETALNTLRRLTFQPTQERENFKALDDVNFHINEGEVLGIIGHNGAGKSTLLKHLANISKPTKGEVIVRGSVAPLIEVGAGVNPELTGRENIFLNGAILGIPKKIIKRKLDEIIDFSELEQFIDTPVKRYSSGMTVKLGFSIATSMDADILIVDEVLSVGDMAFQRKCFDRMENLIKRRNKTVLVVSHNIRQIERMSSRVLLLESGKIITDSNAKEACSIYYNKSTDKVISNLGSSIDNSSGYYKNKYPNSHIDVVSISFLDLKTNATILGLNMHDGLKIKIEFICNKDIDKCEIVAGFHTTDFIYISSSSTASSLGPLSFPKGKHCIEFQVPDVALMPGVFGFRLSFIDSCRQPIWYAENIKLLKITPGLQDITNLPKGGLVDFRHKWVCNPSYISNPN